MLNFIYIVQSKWYLRLKISVQGPFNQLKNVLCKSSHSFRHMQLERSKSAWKQTMQYNDTLLILKNEIKLSASDK